MSTYHAQDIYTFGRETKSRIGRFILGRLLANAGGRRGVPLERAFRGATVGPLAFGPEPTVPESQVTNRVGKFDADIRLGNKSSVHILSRR